MAKYTREQRQRAVELYVKYECCAADVIRELGYPSREALRMWHRDWLDEQGTGVSSQRGERYARYTEEQKRASVDHYLTHGRRASRTMRQMGYPSKEVLASWIDELAPGERRIRRGPVPGELKRDAVLKVASGELSSREAAEAVGVDSSVVRNWKRQLLGDAKGLMVAKREPERGDSSQQDNPDALRGEIATLRADLERLRAEQRAMEIRLAIMKGAAELVGKEPGADPDNLTSREKTTLIKDISETLGVNAESLLKEVGIARSTYYYQLKAMRRPDKNANLLSLVREALRVQARPPRAQKRGHHRVGQAHHAPDDQPRHGPRAQEREALQFVQGRDRRRTRESREPRLPRHRAEPAVGHGHHRVQDPGGQGVPVAGHRLPRRHARRLDDRHEPQRRPGQRHASRRVRHAQARRDADHPLGLSRFCC